MTVPEALLATKLHIPRARPNLVHRTRLIGRLDQGLQAGHKLSLVCAPVGFGKTTLVTEWLSSAARAVAWLSLDEHDNDPARFLAYLIAALRQIDASIGETTETLLQSPQSSPPERVLTSLINDVTAISTPFILALDDYQTIDTPAIHQQLAFLSEHQPLQMHLVILSREDPPLPLARLRARGQVGEIRQDDLRFTAEESAEFLHEVMRLDISADDITLLEHRTEGWLVGLQLAALSLHRQADARSFVQAFAGSNRYILDYLFEEVLQRQADKMMIGILHLMQMATTGGVFALAPKLYPRQALSMVPEEARETYRGITSADAKCVAAIREEYGAYHDHFAAVRAAHIASLGDIPLIVLSHGKTQQLPGLSAEVSREFEQICQQMHVELAAQSSNGKRIVAEKSGHYIQLDQPELVIDAIHQVVEAARHPV